MSCHPGKETNNLSPTLFLAFAGSTQTFCNAFLVPWFTFLIILAIYSKHGQINSSDPPTYCLTSEQWHRHPSPCSQSIFRSRFTFRILCPPSSGLSASLKLFLRLAYPSIKPVSKLPQLYSGCLTSIQVLSPVSRSPHQVAAIGSAAIHLQYPISSHTSALCGCSFSSSR